MPNDRITIVGAGLAGLTAAINLARDGRDVLVLDKQSRPGGRPEFRPDGAGSPFDLEALRRYTGIDISPACRPIEKMVFSVFGRRTEIYHAEGSETFMVERGPRSTSLDTLLHETALEAGVEFEWGFSLRSQADVARLPEGSIVATGLEVEGFEAMGIPYVPFWGWYAKRMVDDERTLAWCHVDRFTLDYGFTTQINGTLFSLLFQREKPPTKRDKRGFEERIAEEGLELDGWSDLYGGAAPHRTLGNPVLFKNNMIVVGTLAGVMEPMMNFGMLGAMVSGKIGAIAVTDRGRAYEEFKKLVSFFRRSLIVKRIHDRSPEGVRKALWRGMQTMQTRTSPEWRNRGMRFVPGYGKFGAPPG